jgi:hypothetical protein
VLAQNCRLPQRGRGRVTENELQIWRQWKCQRQRRCVSQPNVGPLAAYVGNPGAPALVAGIPSLGIPGFCLPVARARDPAVAGSRLPKHTLRDMLLCVNLINHPLIITIPLFPLAQRPLALSPLPRC